jgi:hypothetical protein
MVATLFITSYAKHNAKYATIPQTRPDFLSNTATPDGIGAPKHKTALNRLKSIQKISAEKTERQNANVTETRSEPKLHHALKKSNPLV